MRKVLIIEFQDILGNNHHFETNDGSVARNAIDVVFDHGKKHKLKPWDLHFKMITQFPTHMRCSIVVPPEENRLFTMELCYN